jgi:hypothetical protein
MGDAFDIYECLPTGDLMWRGGCANLDEVHARLAEFAKSSNNQFQAKDSAKKVVARVHEAGDSEL